ncbi:MAG: hypothetical protein JO297_14060 [Nitrososphaeraceae archaeon]|nr:hypothetical protein [Nitrososphaeraceae archaeon]
MNISYIRHIEGCFKQGKRDEGQKRVVDFYNGIVGKVKGLKRFYDDRQLRRSTKSSEHIFMGNKRRHG